MDGHIFIAQGDITQLSADAIGYSSSTHLTRDGDLYPAFRDHVPGFAEEFERLAADHAPCRLGESFWLPLRGHGKPKGVVVVAATGAGRRSSFAEKARLAVAQALETAIAALCPESAPATRLLIALPTFRQGQGGDRNRRLESGEQQIAAAREFLIRHANVDVAFIPYTTDSYQIFLQARRNVLGEPRCPLDLPDLTELEEAIRQGRCVLFIGSGLSQGAGLPDWKALIRRLQSELGIASQKHDGLEYYLDLAQWYQDKFGKKQLAKRIQRQFAGSAAKPTLAHYLLLSLPIRQVVTTNYDNLIEAALAALRRYPLKIVRGEDVVLTGQREGVCVVKLHGDATHAESIILSRDDFEGFFRVCPAMAALLEGLLLNQTFLFVGYGLRDPNFRQIHGRIAEMLQDAKLEAFAVTLAGDAETSRWQKDQWKRKGIQLLAISDKEDDGVQNALRFYDWLVDRIALRTANLFLTRDVEYEGPLGSTRHALLDQVGEAIEDLLSHSGGSPSDDQHLATILAFLTAQGWRPQHQQLSKLWVELAKRTKDLHDRRRLLIEALRHTERFDWADKIRAELAKVEKMHKNTENPPPGAVDLPSSDESV